MILKIIDSILAIKQYEPVDLKECSGVYFYCYKNLEKFKRVLVAHLGLSNPSSNTTGILL